MITYRENQSELGVRAQERRYKFNLSAMQCLPVPYRIGLPFQILTEVSTFVLVLTSRSLQINSDQVSSLLAHLLMIKLSQVLNKKWARHSFCS